jgi:alkylhydroperoxidase/carboxymuconolactone decarboxylase family protein YurZ
VALWSLISGAASSSACGNVPLSGWAVLAAVGEAESAAQVAIGTALNLGVSKEDIGEVFIQTVPQVGLIHVIAALETLSRSLEQRKVPQAS